MQQDVPGYALISGGPRNGLYVRDGQYYRRSSGKMFNVDTGAASAGAGGQPPAADPRADADARLAAMKAEAAGKPAPEEPHQPAEEGEGAGAPAPEAAPLPPPDAEYPEPTEKAKRRASEIAVITDGLVADSTAAELFALASSLVKELVEQGKPVDFTPVKGNKGKRDNAEFIAKYRE